MYELTVYNIYCCHITKYYIQINYDKVVCDTGMAAHQIMLFMNKVPITLALIFVIFLYNLFIVI